MGNLGDATEGNQWMRSDNDTKNDDATQKGDELNLDFWSDEGARRYNEMLDEGDAYAPKGVHLGEDFEACLEYEPCEYLDPELCDPNEETLPPGEMEMIFENCFIM